MRRSKAELYVHFVWATHRRHPWITPEIEQAVYAAIIHEANRNHADVLAVGGLPDHIHLVLKKPPTISESALMQRIKGVSSTLIREKLINPGEIFRWQEGYGVFSFHAHQTDRVVQYVLNQKQTHESGKTRQPWEETDEETPPKQNRGSAAP